MPSEDLLTSTTFPTFPRRCTGLSRLSGGDRTREREKTVFCLCASDKDVRTLRDQDRENGYKLHLSRWLEVMSREVSLPTSLRWQSRLSVSGQLSLVGPRTRIWHITHVMKGARIGHNCIIGQNVMIGEDVRMGDYCKVQNNVSVHKGV